MDALKMAAAIVLAVALWGVFFRLIGNIIENLRLGILKLIKFINNE